MLKKVHSRSFSVPPDVTGSPIYHPCAFKSPVVLVEVPVDLEDTQIQNMESIVPSITSEETSVQLRSSLERHCLNWNRLSSG